MLSVGATWIETAISIIKKNAREEFAFPAKGVVFIIIS
jgi:hypothetical protein